MRPEPLPTEPVAQTVLPSASREPSAKTHAPELHDGHDEHDEDAIGELPEAPRPRARSLLVAGVGVAAVLFALFALGLLPKLAQRRRATGADGGSR